MRWTRLSPLLLALILSVPLPAHAQYKNTSFGLDLGGWFIVRPAPYDEEGRVIQDPDQRPLRLSNGVRLGGETNFKMSQDHWWFTGRVNFSISTIAGDDAFDVAARDSLGTLLGIQGSIGVRYVIFTDKIRPYIQAALSYLRLFSFTDDSCGSAQFCVGGSNSSSFLPHPNVGGLHLQPGLEIIFTRDIAFHLFADVQKWIVFNADDNLSVVAGAGLLFFM